VLSFELDIVPSKGNLECVNWEKGFGFSLFEKCEKFSQNYILCDIGPRAVFKKFTYYIGPRAVCVKRAV